MHSLNVDEITHISLTMITSTKVQMLSINNTTLTHQQKDSKKNMKYIWIGVASTLNPFIEKTSAKWCKHS